MSIPALGGGGAQQVIQRALRDAERALAEELGGTDGENAATTSATRAGSGGTVSRAVRRRAAGASADPSSRADDGAIVVELGEREKPEDLKAVGGWITTKRTLETKGLADPKRFDGADIKEGAEEAPAADGGTTVARPTPQPGQPAPATGATAMPLPGEPLADDAPVAIGAGAQADEAEEVPDTPTQAPPSRSQSEGDRLDRMIVVLKKTGIDFRDAYQVLREINSGAKLPPKAELQARWALADPDAWEEKARTEQAARPTSAPADEQRPAQPPARAADADLRKTAVDDVIRDRDWHRDNPDGADRPGNGLSVRGDDNRPTLQSVVRLDQTNQAYIAGLSTAEFQRLVTILGKAAPEWFWDLRGHGGLRGFAERPTVAKLNSTRIAGTRLGAWIVAVAGSGALWYVGMHTGQWW